MDRNLIRLIKDVVESATYGNSALKTIVDNIYARLGAPVGASTSADIAAVQADVDRIEARVVGTTTKVHPTLAAHVVVTGAAGANALGAAAEIAAAAAIAALYYVDGVSVTATSGAGIFELVLYHGAADTEFARIQFITTGRYLLQATKQIPANDKITAKVASLAGGSQTATVAISYHQ